MVFEMVGQLRLVAPYPHACTARWAASVECGEMSRETASVREEVYAILNQATLLPLENT